MVGLIAKHSTSVISLVRFRFSDVLEPRTGVQSLVNGALMAGMPRGPVVEGGSTPVRAAFLLHESFVVWSTVSLPDTRALYQLATAALLPALRNAAHPSLGRRLTSTLG